MQSLLINPQNSISNRIYAQKCAFTGKVFLNATPFKGEISDLKQYKLSQVGEYYCGPVSAANAIVMQSQKGFSNLLTGDSNKLIYELASYFKTDKNGTTTANMCKGLDAFVASKGYKSKIQYQGFRQADNYKTGALPDLKWIREEINKGNTVLLNLGVYKKSVQNGETVYKRQYGHFVTATGEGHDGLNNYLTMTDPYDRAKGNHFIRPSVIEKGKFIHNADDNEAVLTDNAAGFYEISPRFNYFASDEVAVLNGVVSLEVKK